MNLHNFIDHPALNQALAAQITHLLVESIHMRGHAYLVVSGGTTPVNLFKTLSITDIPWEKVTITLADERCVPLDDKDRNEGLVKQFLLQHNAEVAQFVSLYHDELSPRDSLQQVEFEIAAMPTFDVVVLGMGEDGHTASLFPDSNELALGLDDNAPAVLWINPITAPHQRISLSKSRLLNSRMMFLLLVGENKQVVLDQALASADIMEMPIRAFLNQPNMQVMYAPK